MKQYLYKIYDSTGATFIKLLDATAVLSEPRFSHTINAGQSELRISLKAEFDDFDEGNSIDFANVVRVYEIDDNNPKGRLIYTGWISRYAPVLTGDDQHLEITCLGLGTLLQNAFYKNGAAYQKTHTSDDVAVVFKAVIDHFNTVYSGSLISYDGSSIDTTSNALTYEFDKKKHREALAKAFEFAPAGWYWRIEADGKIYLKAKPSTATHTFTIGKDILEAHVIKTIEKLANGYLLEAGTTPAENYYEDATSKTNYGTRERTETDMRITLPATADSRGNAVIANEKNPRTAPRLVISGDYDLMGIKPGDTCKVQNLKKGSTLFGSNMQIVRVDYQPDRAVLQLAERSDEFTDALKIFTS